MSDKLKGLLFIIFALLTVISTIFLVIYQYWYFILLFSICVVFEVILFFSIKNKKDNTLRKTIGLHKKKEVLLLEKTKLQKQFLKRKVSEKQFKSQINDLDKEIVDLDFKIKYINKIFTDKKKELEKKIEFIQKLFFKNQIHEDLFEDFKKELSKEINKL